MANSRLSNEQLQAALSEFAKANPEVTQVLYAFADGTKICEATEHGARFPTLTPLVGMEQRPENGPLSCSGPWPPSRPWPWPSSWKTCCKSASGAQPHPYVTGSVPLYCRGQKQLFTSLLTSFTNAFVPISLIMGLALRSFYFAILAIIPNILPVGFILALMGWFSIPLSVATVTVASIVFGIVVDDTIHFLHRLQAATKVSGSAADHLHDTIHYAGPAMLTACGDFRNRLPLVFLRRRSFPLRQFGLLISGALWLAIFCDMVLLPLLLLSWKRQ